MTVRSTTARVVTILAVLAASMLAGATTASAAHMNTPNPDGASPWHYTESWRISGSHYNEGLHTEAYNDYYALDFGNPNGSCGRRLYPLWNGMRIDTVDRSIGRLTMTKSINGVTYRVKYMHMSRINNSVNDIVGTLDVVGLTGDLGRASGCHIHIGVHRWYNSQWYSIPPRFCGRTYPDNATLWRGC